MKIKLFLQIIISLLSFPLVPFRVRRRESGSFKFQNSILSLCLFWVALFFFVIKPLAFAEEKIPVFPSTPVEAYTIYASLAVFWLAIIGLIVIIKMKLNEIDRIQKTGN